MGSLFSWSTGLSRKFPPTKINDCIHATDVGVANGIADRYFSARVNYNIIMAFSSFIVAIK